MMLTRTILILSLFAAGITTIPLKSVVKLTPNVAIKCIVSADITHYAQYTAEGNLVASYNDQTNVYTGAFVTEYGAVNYSPEDAEILFNLFSAHHKRVASPLLHVLH